MKEKQMSDQFVTGVLLALVGGFLDAYTYFCRGKVFANAQTGNMVLFGIKLSEGNIAGAGYYLAPIFAFVSGIFLANIIKTKYKEKQMVHWRQIIVVVELIMLLVVANIPKGAWDAVANVIVSFVCALQVESFRTVNGYAYASTMCTGNLRSATEKIFNYIRTKDIEELKTGFCYYGIIVFFILGAVIGAIVTKAIIVKSAYVAVVGLGIVLLLMFKKTPEYSGDEKEHS